VLTSVRDLAAMLWEEALLLVGRAVDFVRAAPRLLIGSSQPDATADAEPPPS
jgi:hypothetical protein